MKEKEVIQYITNWISDYSEKSNTNGFVVGISGGIDSALTSTLSALSEKPTLCVEMPIYQNNQQVERGKNHIKWLQENFKNVNSTELDLSNVLQSFKSKIPSSYKENNELSLVNVRARLRMTTLYYFATLNDMNIIRPKILYPLFSDLTTVNGVGPKTAKLIEKKIGYSFKDSLEIA